MIKFKMVGKKLMLVDSTYVKLLSAEETADLRNLLIKYGE